jgi:hypothetical protein
MDDRKREPKMAMPTITIESKISLPPPTDVCGPELTTNVAQG